MEKMVLTKVFSIRPSKDSEESKKWTLELTIPESTTVRDLAQAVLGSEVIKVQNGNRNNFDKYENGHVFKKTFAKPGYESDPMETLIAEAVAAGVDVKSQKALTEFIMAKIEAKG